VGLSRSKTRGILLYIQQDATLRSLFYLETALHISGGTITHHQERKQMYLQHLVFVTTFCYLPLSWKSWNWFECAVGGVRHSNQFLKRGKKFFCPPQRPDQPIKWVLLLSPDGK